MEETLRLLYQLQKIDSNLDEVEESKGDLPERIRGLEEESTALAQKVVEKQQYIENQIASRNKADDDINDFQEKLKKYKAQQYQVRNNKEYDAITKEIDFAEESIKELTKEFEDFENQMAAAKKDLEEMQGQLEEKDKLLEEKKEELAEISKETDEEETKYRREREKIVVKIDKQHLSRYDMIRSARGKAVVTVRKESCSGCGNRIPPQHIIELRRNDHVYLCQHCGRIVVSDEFAGNNSSK